MTSPQPLPVTLQINLVAGDYQYAREILPHQLRQLGAQCSDILLTIDTNGGASRRRQKDADAYQRIMDWLATLKAVYPNLRILEADYQPATMRRVSQAFFGCDALPARTSRGAFYAYFEGLTQAAYDYVLHLDSDILVGGGSVTWICEAVSWLEKNPDVLTCSPLPGPPRADLQLKTQSAEKLTGLRGGYRFHNFSTRVFFFDRRRITHAANKLRLRRAAPRQQMRAYLEGFSPLALPEELVSDYLRESALTRVDFLGQEPGLWTLHPPFRSDDFQGRLPAIIHAVESGDLPIEQLGDYDINDSMVDWSSARAAIEHNRWWRRYRSNFLRRLRSFAGERTPLP